MKGSEEKQVYPFFSSEPFILFCLIYSSRKASAGSTFTALRTGINVPTNAMTSKAR